MKTILSVALLATTILAIFFAILFFTNDKDRGKLEKDLADTQTERDFYKAGARDLDAMLLSCLANQK